ncbi:MAG: hypothetical protein ACJ71Z_09930 [Aeromicrobium sp.]
MTGPSVQAATRLVMDLLADRGWPDRQGVGLAVVRAVLADPDALTGGPALRAAIPRGFLLINRVPASVVVAAIQSSGEELLEALRPVTSDALPAIINLDDVDTFARSSEVAATDVAKYAAPIFDVPEDYIKRMVAEIAGEPYVQKDWGGEFDDMFSGQAQLKARRVTTTFMFKGPGLRRKVLRPKDLGSNGDQIDRMLLQPAELFVVQFVGKIEASVRRQLQRGIVSRRAEGSAAVGTLWDGADTARLAAAYGYLDLSTGAVRALSPS